MVFWSDGFDPTTSMKQNRKSVWIMTVTFFCYNLASHQLYMVEPCLLTIGPGKSTSEAKEDHSCIFERLKTDLRAITDTEDGSLIPFTYISRAHNGQLCEFYFCKETYFTESHITVESDIYIMDNPERTQISNR